MRWKKPAYGEYRSVRRFAWFPVKDWDTGWTYWWEHIYRDQKYVGDVWIDRAIRPMPEGETGYG